MHITKPPMTRVEINRIQNGPYGDFEKADLLFPSPEDTRGSAKLTMGPLYDYVYSCLREDSPDQVLGNVFRCNFFFEMRHNVVERGARPGVHLKFHCCPRKNGRMTIAGPSNHHTPEIKSRAYDGSINKSGADDYETSEQRLLWRVAFGSIRYG